VEEAAVWAPSHTKCIDDPKVLGFIGRSEEWHSKSEPIVEACGDFRNDQDER
jgi:hypothetical protein